MFDERSSAPGSFDFTPSESCCAPALSAKQHELERRVTELSVEQRDAYDCIVYYTEPGSRAGQLLMILGGAAGTGKSKVLLAIVLYLRLQYGAKAVEVVAETNAAARLVDNN